MCWNEPISWLTFAIGTTFNAGSFVYFRHAHDSMTFLILYWQYTLFMQLAEGSAWRTLNHKGFDADIREASRAAMMLNVTQPFVLLIAVSCIRRSQRSVAFTAAVMYAALLISEAVPIWKESVSIKPKPGCSQLNLGWWDGSRSALYILASLFAFAAIPSRFWACANALLFLTTLSISALTYPCGGGSLWCWMVFNAGLVLVTVDIGRRAVCAKLSLFGADV